MSDLTDLGACELAATIRERRASSREVVQAFLARIERLNGPINAIVSLDEEGALRKAQQADEARARGERVGPLHGVPVTLKDCHATAGIRTTAGHPPLDQVPTRDGVIAARLRGAGAIILGKTNVSRLLQDIQADNPIFGRTSNPWDLTRTSGGSSGGAAAALAARLTPLDVGSDFAGSIRIPAHFCGVFGLKPTEHRVSMAGQLPELSAAARAPSLWSCGPMARSVDDLDLGLRVIAGADGSPEIPPVPAPQRVPMESKDLRIAWAPSFPGVPVQKAIRVALESLCNRWSNEGARLEERLPQISFEEQAKVRVCLAKAVDAPGSVSAADYFQALTRRLAIIEAWERFFEIADVLLCPVAMVTAFPHCGTGSPLQVDGEPVSYWRIIGHCAPFNLTGHPAVVVPIGRDADGLPIGAQLVGRRWSEASLLAIAALVRTISS